MNKKWQILIDSHVVKIIKGNIPFQASDTDVMACLEPEGSTSQRRLKPNK